MTTGKLTRRMRDINNTNKTSNTSNINNINNTPPQSSKPLTKITTTTKPSMTLMRAKSAYGIGMGVATPIMNISFFINHFV